MTLIMVTICEHKGKTWREPTVTIRILSQNSSQKQYNLTLKGIDTENTYEEIKWLFTALSRSRKITEEE